MHTLQKDTLQVSVSENSEDLGRSAARMAAEAMRELLVTHPVINMIFAAAPSQETFLAALIREKAISWGRINAFHMDEYLGLDPGSPQLFGSFLTERIFNRVPFRSVNLIDSNPLSIEAECERYSQLLAKHPVDIVCLGIGENTHIAFNEPITSDFEDAALVKKVRLDSASRVQQVHDGQFKKLNDVPDHAISLTIPALMRAKRLFCMVPGKTKKEAVKRTLTEDVSKTYPATILRTHPRCFLFLDKDSYQGDESESI